MAIAANSILVDQQVLHSNSLATVTEHCVMIRNFDRRSQTIVPLTCISNAKTITVSQRHWIVFAVGSFLVAAASKCSKEGGGAEIPFALLSVVFVVTYLVSRRASVILDIESGPANTMFGTVGEAKKLIAALRSAHKPEFRHAAPKQEQAATPA
jgi:hypothetical protein